MKRSARKIINPYFPVYIILKYKPFDGPWDPLDPWNPGALGWAANGVQTGAQNVYAMREKMRAITGSKGKNSTL